MINKEENIIFKGSGDIEFLEWFIKNKYTEVYEEYYQQVDNSIKNLIFRIKELEEINKEHKKLNGELQEKYSKLENHYNCRLKDIEMLNAHIEKLNGKIENLEETIKGKSIQELGMSDLYYKED